MNDWYDDYIDARKRNSFKRAKKVPIENWPPKECKVCEKVFHALDRYEYGQKTLKEWTVRKMCIECVEARKRIPRKRKTL